MTKTLIEVHYLELKNILSSPPHPPPLSVAAMARSHPTLRACVNRLLKVPVSSLPKLLIPGTSATGKQAQGQPLLKSLPGSSTYKIVHRDLGTVCTFPIALHS